MPYGALCVLKDLSFGVRFFHIFKKILFFFLHNWECRSQIHLVIKTATCVSESPLLSFLGPVHAVWHGLDKMPVSDTVVRCHVKYP